MSDITTEDRVRLAKLCGKTISTKWTSTTQVFIETEQSECEEWQPDEILNHAFECVDAWCAKPNAGCHLDIYKTNVVCRLSTDAGKPSYRTWSILRHDELTVAICRAVLEAIGDE